MECWHFINQTNGSLFVERMLTELSVMSNNFPAVTIHFDRYHMVNDGAQSAPM